MSAELAIARPNASEAEADFRTLRGAELRARLGLHAPAGSRILVAMSGGVDSALAAILLQRCEYEIVGVNMRTYKPTDHDRSSGRRFQSCCSPEDALDARAVAEHGGFPFYVLDLEREFHSAVIQPFIDSYVAGRTPNPCVLCNNHLKLGVLLDKAHLWGCDYVATGHYARVARLGDRWTLQIAAGTQKDQTYYLFGLTQQQISRFLCPLGNLTKPEVRELAREAGLVTVADKPESMEICFVPNNDYRSFLQRKLDTAAIRPGDIVTTDSKVIGRHTGLHNYTVGQRRGLNIDQLAGAGDREPQYVVALLPMENLVVVGPRSQTLSRGLTMTNTNWLAADAPAPGTRLRAAARIRHHHPPAPCWVSAADPGSLSSDTPNSQNPGAPRFYIEFDEPQSHVAPGQAVVLYLDDLVLGGGWIADKVPA